MAATQEGATGGEARAPVSAPGKRPLTPAELHEKRKAWGKQYGKVMSEIKRQHEQKGI